MKDILYIILITLIPGLELRASIPAGIAGKGLNPVTVFLVATISNIILGIILYFTVRTIIDVLTRIHIFNKLYQLYIVKVQKKLHRSMEKWGHLGLAVFVGIPLPGSGVYSGALGSYVLGIDFRRYLIGTIAGVLIAGVAILLMTLTYGKLII